jgi:predicted nucleic acid-binding protein
VSPAIVVDASVVVKWVLEEEDSALAEALANRTMTAPNLLLIECASALLRRARAGDLPFEAVSGKIHALRQAPVRLTPAEHHLDQAVALAVQMRHPVYDCLYLALALARGVPMVSADRRFVSAVRRHAELSSSIVLLAETAH